MKTSVLFICHGNICRSPMAEFIFKDMLQKVKLSDKVEVASRATSTEEIGSPVYPKAKQELEKHGIGCAGKRAKQLEKSEYNDYDYIIAMDDMNVRNIERITERSVKEGKIKKLLEFVGSKEDISDPWYTRRFDVTYEDIVRGCEGLMKVIKESI